jgi:uncharacterized glyoxalase superfamily protein PhnB
MSTPSKPDSCPWLMPMLTVTDVMASLDFYEKAFGFTRGMTMPDEEGRISYADMLYKGMQVVMMMPEGAWGSQARTPVSSAVESPVGLYVYCDNVDELCKQAGSAHAEIVNEPETMFWGDRTSCIKDPDGHTWTFATHVADVDLEDMEAK